MQWFSKPIYDKQLYLNWIFPIFIRISFKTWHGLSSTCFLNFLKKNFPAILIWYCFRIRIVIYFYNCHPENRYANTLPSISVLYNTFFHFFQFFFSIKQVLSLQHRMANRKHVIILAGILIRRIDIFRRKLLILYFIFSYFNILIKKN